MIQLPSPDRLHAPQDSVLVESPLPGGVAELVRFIFGVPQWIQIGGALVGGAVAAALAILMWRRRRAIVAWAVGRSRQVRLALAVAGVLVLVAAAGAGTVSWNYMQHDNGFCTGCHVMGEAYQRFTASEHDTLSCHDCHQQSIFASTRQLYLWVLERPGDIGEHSKVPNTRCESCHVTEQAEVWQHVATTAGHRTHLESDSSALRDIQCVTCHGLEVHSFVPVDSTCAQADCHINQRIALGPMADQTALHCANCHEFTVDVPLLATRDSAAGTLVPKREQCFSCHEMQEVLAEFDVDRDPHRGACGMCHNPHLQETASEAGQSCTNAGCHDNWRTEPFHVGTNHGRMGDQCLTCHVPHQARVDASDCAACHQAVYEREDVPRAIRERLRRALPFDTAAAAARVGLGWGLGIPSSQASGEVPPGAFPHARHADLTCITCHTTRDGNAGLVFQQPRGCQLCHHQDGVRADCLQCHANGGRVDEENGRRVAVTVTVVERGPRTRDVTFRHADHAEAACTDCHQSGPALAATEAARTCTDCHGQHHAANRACAQCHVDPAAPEAHGPPANAHVACTACHAEASISPLVPDRAFCAACHAPQRDDHYALRECTTCHMLATPEAWRRHLTAGTR